MVGLFPTAASRLFWEMRELICPDFKLVTFHKLVGGASHAAGFQVLGLILIDKYNFQPQKLDYWMVKDRQSLWFVLFCF